ncbi:hypothetical protein [Haloferula sp. A504]|uniref:hypothetical protein n=1 Tax=Haloferula sp. A504 TaxID=3373601 RepID=UPI0031C40473|nr:hypothetical protein [Verrucomicrobiaceae bacterium E54]
MTHPTLAAELTPFLKGSLLDGVDLGWVRGDEVPSPQRDLLVHDRDMTTSLGDFHGDVIALTVLRSALDGDLYRREVTLDTAADGRPVEYGLIVMHLDTFPTEQRQRVVDEQTPLGTILNESGIPYLSAPQGFYTVPRAPLARLFPASSGGADLYGRYNTLSWGDGRVLARILEILPNP